MEANCKVWSSKLNKYLSTRFCMLDNGEIYISIWSGVDENDNSVYRWEEAYNGTINDLGLSFYPG